MNGNRLTVAGEGGGVAWDEDQGPLRKRSRIDQQHVPIQRLSDGFQRLVAELGHVLFQFRILRLRLFVDGADARARDDVVELVEADGLPGILVIGNWILVISDKRGIGGDELCVVQEEFALAVGAFVAGLRGVGAAVVFEVQLAVPDGHHLVVAERRDGFEELPDAGLFDLRQGGEVLHGFDVFEHLARGAAAAVAEAVGHQQVILQFLLLEVLPRAERLGDVGHRVVGAGEGTAHFLDRAEVRQDLRAVDALPEEGIEGQAVVLAPADLDGHEIAQARLLDQLRQRPGIAEDIGQPQHGRFGVLAKVFAEETAPEQELAREGFRAAQVAVRFDPHATHRLPTPFFDLLLDGFEQRGLILFHELIQLRLALREVIIGELLHQAQGGVEGALRFAAGLADCPQPGHIDVGMACGVDDGIQRRPRFFEARLESLHGRLDTGIKGLVAQRGARVEQVEGVIQCVEQVMFGGLILVEIIGRIQRGARQRDEVPRGLVDLHHGALAHVQFGEEVAALHAAQARPAVQGQDVFLTIAPFGLDKKFLVMTVAGGVGDAVHVGQRFGVREIARFAQRQIERDGLGGVHVLGHEKLRAQDEILHPRAPVLVGVDFPPLRIVHVHLNGCGCGGTRQVTVAEGGQGFAFDVNQWGDEFEARLDLGGRPALLVIHGLFHSL